MSKANERQIARVNNALSQLRRWNASVGMQMPVEALEAHYDHLHGVLTAWPLETRHTIEYAERMAELEGLYEAAEARGLVQ